PGVPRLLRPWLVHDDEVAREPTACRAVRALDLVALSSEEPNRLLAVDPNGLVRQGGEFRRLLNDVERPIPYLLSGVQVLSRAQDQGSAHDVHGEQEQHLAEGGLAVLPGHQDHDAPEAEDGVERAALLDGVDGETRR